MSRRVALVGAAGQLAQDLKRVWAERHPADELIGLSHGEIEVTDLESVRSALLPHAPNLVINTSAYHRVDEIEDNPGQAFAVNGTGALNLARTSRELDAALVHLSTDYVFSGSLARPYTEADLPDPPCVYGVSKVAGEMLIRTAWPRHFIVRSSGLYGVAGSAGKGGNFVETMLRLAGEGRPLRVVDDQVLTPTATLPLARQLAELVESDAFGTYHATCQGECSWYRFAAEIFDQAGIAVDLSTQTTAESGARAVRPTYSVLDNAALRGLSLEVLPPWEEALAGYLQQRKERVAASL